MTIPREKALSDPQKFRTIHLQIKYIYAMRNNLDNGVLHAMRAFVSVVDAGSFSRAGEQLNLTTAQVSRLVSELEKRLQTKLLQRTTRQRVLTDTGAAYLERCREVLHLVADAEAQAGGATQSVSGRLRIQCMANFGQQYVAPLLPEFFALHPGVQIEYSTSQYVPEMLARGIDISLYLSASLPDSGLVARRLGTTFAVLCASPAYLRAHGTPATPKDLSQHACLQLLNPSVNPVWKLQAAGHAPFSYSPSGTLVAETPDVVCAAAEAGVGITLMPLFCVIDAIRAGRLRRVLTDWRSPDIGVFALMPSRHYLDGKTRAWLQFIDQRLVPAVERDTQFFMTAHEAGLPR